MDKDEEIIIPFYDEKNWFCAKCNTLHSHNTFRYDVCGRENGLLISEFYCIRGSRISGCILCAKPSLPEYNIYITLINQNAESILLHCSERCMKFNKKRHIKDPSLEGYVGCAACRRMFKELKKCGRCKKIYYCSIECQKADWKEHKKNCKSA